MDHYQEHIARRIRYLKSIRDKAENGIKLDTGLKLKINKRKGHIQLYLSSGGTKRKWKYVPVAEINRAKRVAQNEYNKAIIKAIDNEIEAACHALTIKSEDKFEAIYDKLSPERRQLVRPVVLTDDQYIEQWINTNYIKSDIPIEEHFYTDKGEYVRSKSELIIANLLNKNDIPYRYECGLKVGNKLYFPDFTILDRTSKKEVYWEHFGKMGEEEYAMKAASKYAAYLKEGYTDIIITFETDSCPIDVKAIEAIIRKRFLNEMAE
jgi:hypothetical protein